MMNRIETVIVARGHVGVVLEQDIDQIITSFRYRIVQWSITIGILDAGMSAVREQNSANVEMTFADA